MTADSFSLLGKGLMVIAAIVFIIGAILAFGKWLPLGRLPGDVFMQKEQWSLFFPITSCIIISIVLTILLNLFTKR